MISNSPEETMEYACGLAAQLPRPRAILALHGDLGSGKTCFVRGLALGLGIHEPVTSPTFTLVREYAGTRPLIHMDLYRLGTEAELIDIGIEDLLQREAVIVIEWAERADSLLPPSTLHVHFRAEQAADVRAITLQAFGGGA